MRNLRRVMEQRLHNELVILALALTLFFLLCAARALGFPL